MTKNYLPSSRCIDHFPPWRLCLAGLLLGMLVLGTSRANAEASATPDSPGGAGAKLVAAAVKPKESRMWISLGKRRFAVSLADTDAARAFAARLPLTLDMSDLNGNEKKFDLPTALPAHPSRAGTIRNGDLMLYGTHTVVVFYLTFDSAYSYTPLGRVDDATGLAQALGERRVAVTFSRQ